MQIKPRTMRSKKDNNNNNKNNKALVPTKKKKKKEIKKEEETYEGWHFNKQTNLRPFYLGLLFVNFVT